jgi:hypothetical protein
MRVHGAPRLGTCRYSPVGIKADGSGDIPEHTGPRQAAPTGRKLSQRRFSPSLSRQRAPW